MRLIDADALIEEMPTVMAMQDTYLPIHFKEWLIDEAPTIEPKRGVWKPFDLKWGRSIWYCTACEESTEVPCDIWKHKPIYKYCPNCGADMREREGE